MCRLCTRLASLTARGATALLRSCSAPQTLGHSAHGGAVSEALQRWCHTSALQPPFVTAQARRHLRPSSTFTAVSHSPRGFACRTKFDAPPPKMVRFPSSLWFHSCFRRVLTLALCRATRCWWSMTPTRWTASSPWRTPSRCAAASLRSACRRALSTGVAATATHARQSHCVFLVFWHSVGGVPGRAGGRERRGSDSQVSALSYQQLSVSANHPADAHGAQAWCI